MDYLFESWGKIQAKIKNKHIFLFLDYDGTLAPIADTPDKAFISSKAKDLLIRFSKDKRFSIAIITGRALKDIKNKLKIEKIIYSGNHGLEIEGPRISFTTPVPVEYRVILSRIKDKLIKEMSLIKGAFIEDKGLSLSLHFRLVDKNKQALIKTAFHETVIMYKIKGMVKTRAGKEVLEVRPAVNWDKGKVVLWLLDRQQFVLSGKPIFPVYIGDDLTDEDAFKALKNKGLTVLVGAPKESCAQYYLKNQKEVADLLAGILKIKTHYARINKSKRAV